MRPTNLNTEELIEQCKSGNQLAQLEIYNRYYKAMYNASYRIVKNSFDAEDIMQDSFLMAFSKLDSLTDNKVFGPWLKRIVINNSIYRFNKKIKKNETSIVNVSFKIEAYAVENKSIEPTKIKAKQILDTLKTLKDNYRIVLTLNLIEGYDYEEISQIMNISYANCRTTISRAKENLRKKLASEAVH